MHGFVSSYDILLRISEEQLLFNPASPYGFSWKVNLVPKYIFVSDNVDHNQITIG